MELVPRSEEELLEEIKIVKKYEDIEALNIPDLLRFDIRSWEGCKIAGGNFQKRIPHVRAIDFALDKKLPFAEFFIQNNINEVLVITGDPPKDENIKVYDHRSVDIIPKIKEEIPGIKIYAAIDQYRGNKEEEIEYAEKKISAGADGFFTQPFFDLSEITEYEKALGKYEIYWGVSPVLTVNSKKYWEKRNKVTFPENFEPTYEWNIEFAKKVLEYCTKKDKNLYFMPIMADIDRYLKGIFSK